MSSIDIMKPLSTVLSSAIIKSQQHQEKISKECRESNLGLLGEKQVCAMQPYSPTQSKLTSYYNGFINVNEVSLEFVLPTSMGRI